MYKPETDKLPKVNISVVPNGPHLECKLEFVMPIFVQKIWDNWNKQNKKEE